LRLGHCSFPHSQHGPPFCTTHNTSPSAFQCDSQAVCCRITLVEPRKLVSRCQALSATHSAMYVPLERAKNGSIQEFGDTNHEANVSHLAEGNVSRLSTKHRVPNIKIGSNRRCHPEQAPSLRSQQPQHLSRIP